MQLQSVLIENVLCLQLFRLSAGAVVPTVLGATAAAGAHRRQYSGPAAEGHPRRHGGRQPPNRDGWRGAYIHSLIEANIEVLGSIIMIEVK